MNIVVLVKSAVDEAELRADGEGRPVLKGAATKMSNFDKLGVEEAVKLKERNGGTVTVVSLGGPDSKGAIKEALAMGGTKAFHILTETDAPPDAIGTAYCIAKAVKKMEGVDLVVCSEGASDTYQGEVGAMVAEFLDMPFLAYAKNVEALEAKVRCEQASEKGVSVLEAKLPAVVSIAAGANQPRYPTLLQVMVAGRKAIEDVPLSSLRDADYPEGGVEVLEVTVQTVDRKRVLLDGSAEEASRSLVKALKQEGLL